MVPSPVGSQAFVVASCRVKLAGVRTQTLSHMARPNNHTPQDRADRPTSFKIISKALSETAVDAETFDLPEVLREVTSRRQ